MIWRPVKGRPTNPEIGSVGRAFTARHHSLNTFSASMFFSALRVSTTSGNRLGISAYLNTEWFVQITAQSIPFAASASGTDFSDISA